MNTSWTDIVDIDSPLPEYPRPQMARHGWQSLNGLWDYAINKSTRHPQKFDGQIVVPFSPETKLSGVGRTLRADEYLWYRRDVELPEGFKGKRIILHFGAVDQIATVWVNSMQVASHIGGYVPFSADITDAIEGDSFRITVRVSDGTEKSRLPRGKQKTRPGKIWYTAQSGIWQTVWMEAVPETYIKSLRITPNYDEATVSVAAEIEGEAPAYAQFNGETYSLPADIPVPDFVPWSPENPKLYGFLVSCGEDLVQSYFAMRKFSVEKDSAGVMRLFLNNEPYFHNGVLDQGYWPDGLYTAPTDEALAYDIKMAKDMGFNMLRKHVKVEPARWYYHCDRLGMLVWQDMSNGGAGYNPAVITAPLLTGINLKDRAYGLFGRKDASGRTEFKAELTEMVDALYNCPCIAMWVIFNEGWGQFDAAKLHDLVRSIDKTRTIDHASGWHDQGIGRFRSDHVYFKSYSFKKDKQGRAVLLSEFGGYNHFVQAHTVSNKNFGYKKYELPVQYQIALEELYKEQIAPAKAAGLSASVYTQFSDVENELNGLMTYDRKIAKIAPETMQRVLAPLKK